MTRRQCPECGGSGRNSEPMDKFERAEYGNPGTVAWESRCGCCRGKGYILFDMMYPTAAEFKAAWREWMAVEVIPEMKAYRKKLKDPVFRKKLAEAEAENLKKNYSETQRLDYQAENSLEIAIKKVEAMR